MRIFFVLVLMSFSVQAETLVFLSDLEGNGAKWDAFIKTSGCFNGSSPAINTKLSGKKNVEFLMNSKILTLAQGCRFYFLGDAVDKGNASIRILRDLVYLKLAFPESVFLIPGNREINKFRFLQEISPEGQINPNNFYRFTQMKVQPSTNIQELNDAYFGKSFGAPKAMDFRSEELGLNNLKTNYNEWSKKILSSLREDVESLEDSPGSGPSKGLLLTYLQKSEMFTRDREIILSHGFIGADNLGALPKIGAKSAYGVDSDFMKINNSSDFNSWRLKLNDFLRASIKTLINKKYADKIPDDVRYLGEELILYQEPTLKLRPGKTSDFNQESVVLGRNSNLADFGNAFDLSFGPEGKVSELLRSFGITIRISGHTPVGQTPLVQKIPSNKGPPSWNINIDSSAEHLNMQGITSLLKLINNNQFFIRSFVTIGVNTGYSKKLEFTFLKNGSDNSKIGERVTCQNKNFTIVGETKKGTYLIYRSDAGFATTNMESNLDECKQDKGV